MCCRRGSEQFGDGRYHPLIAHRVTSLVAALNATRRCYIVDRDNKSLPNPKTVAMVIGVMGLGLVGEVKLIWGAIPIFSFLTDAKTLPYGQSIDGNS